ncbi:MAG: hypothetical protein JNL02_09615 [Saprospiraceae bacterium]|nr:hypothetical protein [Saprospiraceae bacterium]
MPDYILIDGDLALFMPNFGMATVVVQPGTLRATGQSGLGGKKLCVDGDEASVEVPGCMYITAIHTIPGAGTLKIQALAPDQKALKTCSGGKAVLLKGVFFQAVFEVQTPAQQPPPGTSPPIPDPTPQYPGQGQFQTTNLTYKGS